MASCPTWPPTRRVTRRRIILRSSRSRISAADFACEVLSPGGFFVAKVLQGGTEGQLLARLKRDFAVVRHVKPEASRAGSAELYVLATGFRGTAREA